MSTQNFVLAFQRYCNMYTLPQILYSDNAKTFIKGVSVLENSLYSAWVGSARERLIRVLKNCLFKTIGRSRLSHFELLTTLSNCKLTINSRPLTYWSSSANLEFITPNSFLRIHGNSSLMLRSEEEDVWQEQPGPNSLNKSLELQEELIINFKTLKLFIKSKKTWPEHLLK